ncbi:Peptidyl-prolyl isomerase cwc27 [Schaereria dolodes]|nr:Peptidyl-prolyl isomerase cwc27 [Schaereria dolodes]
MSSQYNLEPQPTAKVVLQTTSGDILLELFAKQTPLTSRNFLQLCLDGYYDGTVFHRLVPGFIVQGGDPTGTGEGGEAIYDGGLFGDEFHNRLKFNRRGLLGMANTGRENDNGSQFFFTLGSTEELNGRNTMFGRIMGETIYNLMRIGEAELMGGEANERPLYPTKITGTEILVNPFEDMARREIKSRHTVTEVKKADKKKSKRVGKTLLSFEEDEQDAEIEPTAKKAKFNTKLVIAPEAVVDSNGTDENVTRNMPKDKSWRKGDLRSASPPPGPKPARQAQLPIPNDEEPFRSASSSAEPANVDKVSSLLERTNAQIAELKASMKRNVPAAPSESTRKKSALEQLIPENSVRGRKRKHGAKGNSVNDAQALNILSAFRAKLEKAPPEVDSTRSPARELEDEQQLKSNGHNGTDAAVDDEEARLCDLHFIANCQSCQSWDQHMTSTAEAENDNDKGWMSHALSFEKDRLGKDLTFRRKAEDELVVIDPREKAKDIKDEQRARRMAKGATSTKAWDRDRDRGRLPDRKAGERG